MPRFARTTTLCVTVGGLLAAAPTMLAQPGSGDVTRIDAEVTIAADRSAVWTALTTPEGLRGWIAPESAVELRPGGAYELYFWPDSTDRGMEGTKVLSYLPGEMLSTSGEIPGTWTVWRLEELGPTTTRVRFSGLGRGPEWAERSAYFDDVMDEVLAQLASHVETAVMGR